MRIDDSHSPAAVDPSAGSHNRSTAEPAGTTSGRRIREHATYFLLHQPSTASGGRRGPEWLLEAWDGGGRRSWTMRLARRGACPGATVQVAGAVATRVLVEHMVVVEGWEHLGTDRLPLYLARLRPTIRGTGSRLRQLTDVSRSPSPEPVPPGAGDPEPASRG